MCSFLTLHSLPLGWGGGVKIKKIVDRGSNFISLECLLKITQWILVYVLSAKIFLEIFSFSSILNFHLFINCNAIWFFFLITYTDSKCVHSVFISGEYTFQMKSKVSLLKFLKLISHLLLEGWGVFSFGIIRLFKKK